MNKVQRKVKKHYRELHCDWCNKYTVVWPDADASIKNLVKWKEKFLSPSGVQKVLFICKNQRCIKSRPEGWDEIKVLGRERI